MIRQSLYISAFLLFAGLGFLIWKITKSGFYDEPRSNLAASSNLDIAEQILYVGDVAINKKDIDWEFDLHTKGLLDKQELSSIPEVSDPLKSLTSLREQILTNLVERKLLFQFIQMDNRFDLADPSLYTACVAQWQENLEESAEVFSTNYSRERLKERLCERSIISQYLDKFVFSKIEISPDEMTRFYEQNIKRFEQPEKVKIRQIVLASEREAKRVRNKITSNNFGELATQYSISPESQEGGLLGPFAKGQMPRVFDVAFSMRVGEVRGILKSTYGFHIIKIEEKMKPRKLSLEEAQADIVKIISQSKREEEYKLWVEMALSEISVRSPRL